MKTRRKIRLKYKKERVLLSDVLPYELPVIFTNRYFYRYLVSNGIRFDGTELSWKKDIDQDALAVLNFIFSPYLNKDLTILPNNQIKFKDKVVSIPFLYKIKHKPHKLRRLALIHPVSQMEIVSFYEKYKSLILYYCGQDEFSLRHPERVACYFYYKDRLHHTLLGQKIDKLELFFNEYENLKTYFSYKEYSNIYKFYEDYRYQNAEKRFEHLHKFDIQSCFDSIYTHSITWAVSGGKDEYKRHFRGKGKSFGDDWDSIMQRMNYNETNGIVIGPEFSRIFAEIILQYIDKKVKQTLWDAGYKNNEHYSCYRYVDDVFFYYNDTKVLEQAMSTFEHLLHEYKLCISKEKSDDWERPFITPISMSKIKIDTLLSDFIRMRKSNQDSENVLEDEIAEEEIIDDIDDKKIEEALECKDFIYIISKEVNRAFKSLMIENNVKSKDIMNYTLAVISTKLESLLKKFDKNFYVLSKAIEQQKREDECQKKIHQMEKMLHRYLDGMIDVIFFLYSDCKRVNTTLKMMNILNTLIIYLGSNYKEKDGRIIKRFSPALRDEIFKKIQNEITIVFKTTSFDINAQIETLYFLITLKSMPRHYRIDSKTLNNYLFGTENDRFDTSKLNTLSIIILLYYYGNTKEFMSDKKNLMEGINNKFKSVNLPDKRKDAELIILALDLLACPFITHNDRKIMCKVMQIDNAKQVLIEKYFRRNKFMFTKWTNIDLTKELGAKVSQEVYT